MASATTAAVAPGWAEPAPDRPVPFWESVRMDLHAHLPHELRGGPAPVKVLRRLGVIARSSGFRVTLLYRLSHGLARLGLPGRAAAGLVHWFLRHAYGCTISPSARLYGGLILPHPQNLVIGPGSVLGPYSWVFQNVTFGGVPGRTGLPRVGRDARIYPGAVLVGPITVGDNVMIGANAVVDADVPSRHVLRCHPPDYDPLPDHFHA
jgi:serine O-acetyltransferase